MNNKNIEICNLSINFNKINFDSRCCFGGSQSTSDAVIQQTRPGVALAAGQIGANAALVAGQQAQAGIGAAINSINNQYTAAAATLAPATQEGVQALDQLNQYLQLSPYDPGKEPTAPTAPTLASEAAQITSNQVNQYVYQNMNEVANTSGKYFGNYLYTGVGSQGNGPVVANNKGANSGWGGDFSGDVITGNNFGKITNNPTISGDIKNQLAQEQLNNPNSLDNLVYKSDSSSFNTQDQQWQYANKLNQQYTAQGPLSANDISNKITNLPGYQTQLNQGTAAINQDAAAKGLLGSGAMLKELNTFGQNTLSQFYGNTLSQLASLAGAGQTAAQSLAASQQQQGGALASLLSSFGNAGANSSLAAGNSLSQSLIAANQMFSTMQTGSSSSQGNAVGGIASLVGAFGGL